MTSAEAQSTARAERRWLAVAAGCAFIVLAAITSEALAGHWANSAGPGWGSLVPLAWPRAARVAWWCAVAIAAGGFRLALVRLGIRQHALAVAASVLPFVVFAGGIAAGASWATWH